MNNLSDAELIARYREGRIQAFNTLTRRWQKPVLNFLFRYLGNTQDAEDACQRTFIKMYKKLKELQDINKFQVWLYQVAANQARDQLRQRKRRPAVSLNNPAGPDGEPDGDAPMEISDESAANPDHGAHQAQLHEIFANAMQSIPEEQRVIVVMKIYQGLKFIEIAEALKIPINTVKSRMYYGLKSLREVLQRQDFNEEVLNYEM